MLEDPDWRRWPTFFDVPAAPQIFGSLVQSAGIEGILYTSAITGGECIAIFPQNFLNSTSFVELDDPAPTGVQIRIDSTNFAAIL